MGTVSVSCWCSAASSGDRPLWCSAPHCDRVFQLVGSQVMAVSVSSHGLVATWVGVVSCHHLLSDSELHQA